MNIEPVHDSRLLDYSIVLLITEIIIVFVNVCYDQYRSEALPPPHHEQPVSVHTMCVSYSYVATYYSIACC